MVVVVGAESVDSTLEVLGRFGHQAVVVGKVIAGEPGVTLR
jgi:phosphoribosylformylglycinamidine (FGAM) synthase-like enzyme